MAKAKAAIETEKEDDKQKQRPSKPSEDLPIVKYFDTQACTVAADLVR